jgi:type I restriction enzyme, S subunit
VVGFLFDGDTTIVRFTELFLRTAKEELERFAPATAQKNINLEILSEVAIPLPPLAEQHRIVAEGDRRLSVIDELETVIATNLKRAERLRQSILKRAFEGKLVFQDPSDEPASVLLERIRTECQVEQKTTAKAVSRPSQKSKRPQVAEIQAELFR